MDSSSTETHRFVSGPDADKRALKWYELERITDREMIIRFPTDDPNATRILKGELKFILLGKDDWEKVWQERKNGIFTGFFMGILAGIALGVALALLNRPY